MTIKTPLTERLGIEHPVLLAPMAGISGGRLAAAVSAGGGLGLLGGGYCLSDWIAREQAEAGNARIGIGFITWRLAQRPELLDRALERRPAAVMLSFGDERPFAPRVKAAGVPLICQVQSVEQARRAAEAGADVIVAQGGEAGGHGASRGTLPLVAEIVDVVAAIPVAAAGGIADGRGLAAALMLGAAGVLLGTRFVATEESLASPAAKREIQRQSGDVTVKSNLYDRARGYDWPAPYQLRTFRNAFTERWQDAGRLPESAIADFERAVADADIATAPVVAGEAAGIVTDCPRAGDLVGRIVAEAEKTLRGAAAFCDAPS